MGMAISFQFQYERERLSFFISEKLLSKFESGNRHYFITQ